MAAVLRACSGRPLRPPRPISCTRALPASDSGTSRPPTVFETTKPSTPCSRAISTSCLSPSRPSGVSGGGESFSSNGGPAFERAEFTAPSSARKLSGSSKVLPSSVFGQETFRTTKSPRGASRWKLWTKSSTAASPRIAGSWVFARFTPTGARAAPSAARPSAANPSKRAATASAPSLFRPMRFTTALSSSMRKRRGRVLPVLGRAETDPTSAKPRPGSMPKRYNGTSSAFLSKPAAMPTGLSKRRPNRFCTRSGPDVCAGGLPGRSSQSSGLVPVQAGSSSMPSRCQPAAMRSVSRCARSGSIRKSTGRNAS
mmetsp:Transcript_4200/g.12315  ORF Transcript_4200/g.12315 Transcript_4200/m.12315 type:complete len:313 (-) Transcript_4200:191-1129(-)